MPCKQQICCDAPGAESLPAVIMRSNLSHELCNAFCCASCGIQLGRSASLGLAHSVQRPGKHQQAGAAACTRARELPLGLGGIDSFRSQDVLAVSRASSGVVAAALASFDRHQCLSASQDLPPTFPEQFKYGSGSKIGGQNGTLVNGTKD